MKPSLDMSYQLMENPFFVQVFHTEDNVFYDEDGQMIPNIFELVTPNDLCIFRADPGNNIFPLLYNQGVFVELIDDYNECCGDWYLSDGIMSRTDLNHPEFERYRVMRGEIC